MVEKNNILGTMQSYGALMGVYGSFLDPASDEEIKANPKVVLQTEVNARLVEACLCSVGKNTVCVRPTFSNEIHSNKFVPLFEVVDRDAGYMGGPISCVKELFSSLSAFSKLKKIDEERRFGFWIEGAVDCDAFTQAVLTVLETGACRSEEDQVRTNAKLLETYFLLNESGSLSVMPCSLVAPDGSVSSAFHIIDKSSMYDGGILPSVRDFFEQGADTRAWSIGQETDSSAFGFYVAGPVDTGWFMEVLLNEIKETAFLSKDSVVSCGQTEESSSRRPSSLSRADVLPQCVCS